MQIRVLCVLDVRAFQTDENRDLHSDRLRRFDNTRGDDIASHDSAEDIDQHRLHVLVRQ